MAKFGRYQVAETHSSLRRLHIRDMSVNTLKPVDWEPPIAVLDQEDLLAQGINTSVLIPGAAEVDELGSCTSQANTSALSVALPRQTFFSVTGVTSYEDTKGLEEFSIVFYHDCTDQTGDPSQEWPPTDCGSSGPYVVELDQRRGYVTTERIASGADNIVSMMQTVGGALLGQPFLNDWMEPGADGFVDGNGSLATVQGQIARGVAGGHETYISAIEKLVLYPQSVIVNPWKTIIRLRNSWTRSWGDNGSYRMHLSTISHILAPYCDVRQVVV
jgi:hypothetical protein